MTTPDVEAVIGLEQMPSLDADVPCASPKCEASAELVAGFKCCTAGSATVCHPCYLVSIENVREWMETQMVKCQGCGTVFGRGVNPVHIIRWLS